MLEPFSTSRRGSGVLAAPGDLAKSGVIALIAINISNSASERARPGLSLSAPDERLASFTLLRKLQAGLRSEVWLALPPGSGALAQLTVIKSFFPHAPGPALDALGEELALAQRLSHPNVARTLRVGRDADRSFVVSEYLEGTTLRALLRRLSLVGERLAKPAVARVLLAIVSAVAHAERRAASVVAKVLVNQAVAAEDVFVTFDGEVKLLAFKAQFGSGGAFAASSAEELEEASVYAAVDALLAEHLSPELGAVLAIARGAGVRRLSGLAYVERALQSWQRKLASDGRAELATRMGELFAPERLEARARLERRLEELSGTSQAEPAFTGDEEAAPLSGVRPVQR